MKRRLAAILVADVVGYSSLMEADEEGTAERMAGCKRIAKAEIANADGRLFKTMGDAILAEFASPMNALHCAVGIRDSLALAEQKSKSPLQMRFGLHLADVLVDGSDLIGDGINVAARIQQAADVGSVELSSGVFEQIRRTSPYSFDDLGEKKFHNIGEPIRVYRLRGEIERHVYQIAPTRSSARSKKRPHSLAVMPFEVHSAKEDQQFLAEGIAEELIFELGRFHKLFVTSRSATRALGGVEAEPKSLGERLGVRYILTGSIREFGDRVRLSLSLTETDGGTLVWSNRVSQTFNELVDGLDELVSHIASTMLGRIEESDIVAARRLKPESMTAYEFHLRGLEFHRLGGVTDENLREAVGWFERAIDADPNFARPHAMWVCARAGYPGWEWDDMQNRTQRALELDPNDPEANRIMGSILMQRGNFDASRRYHEKAMSLSPSDAYIKARSAAFYTFAGEPKHAMELLEDAEALDPFLPVWCVEERVAALYALERHEDSLDAARDLTFQTRRSRLYRAASRVALGELERARVIVEEAIAAAPNLSTAFIQANEFYRDRDVKRQLINRLVEAGLPRLKAVAQAS